MINKKDFINKVKAVVIGHAVADALGVPVEFMSREELRENPVTTMMGYGTYPVPKGSWSDDTSMSLCALDAIHNGKVNFDQVMLNFAKWYYQDEYTPTGEMFDVGNTCSMAIERYVKNRMSWQECGLSREMDNGNGSLMRIHPFVLYTFALDTNTRTKIEIIELASALTHAHPRSKMACGFFAFVLWELLSNDVNADVKFTVCKGLDNARKYYAGNMELVHFGKLVHQVADVDNISKTDPQFLEILPKATEDDIISDGYVVNTLESAIWCLFETDNYKDCVLKAVNLGDDTDTVAAIVGALAGAAYGYDTIPQEWRDTLIKREYIENICEKAFSKYN